MEDSEHLNRLRGDINDWNEWRKDNPQREGFMRGSSSRGNGVQKHLGLSEELQRAISR
jgi:hypothetical protein